jgi:hypothetical protein
MVFRDNAPPDVTRCARCRVEVERSAVVLSGQGEPLCRTCNGHALAMAAHVRGQIGHTKEYLGLAMVLGLPFLFAGLGVAVIMAVIFVIAVFRC